MRVAAAVLTAVLLVGCGGAIRFGEPSRRPANTTDEQRFLIAVYENYAADNDDDVLQVGYSICARIDEIGARGIMDETVEVMTTPDDITKAATMIGASTAFLCEEHHADLERVFRAEAAEFEADGIDIPNYP